MTVTNAGVRVAMAVICTAAIGATVWAARLHDRYMVARFLALFAAAAFVCAFPTMFVENLQTRQGMKFLAGMVILLVVVGAFIGAVVFIVGPAQDAHATWLPRVLKNWCADPSRGRAGSTSDECK